MESQPCLGVGNIPVARACTCPACGHLLNGTPDAGRLSPALLAWDREQLHEKEFLAGLKETWETGGLELRDFWHELEQDAGLRD